MKKVLRRMIISTAAIYTVSLVNGGLSFAQGYQTILLAGFVMFFLDTIVEPLLNIIFLPINFLTSGLFKWVIGAILLYALTYFVPGVRVTEWTFAGYTLPIIPQLPVPVITIPSYTFIYLANLVFVAFLFNFFAGIYLWILED